MKMGLIGDVHANLPALEAVFEHARENGVESFCNIGDFVGYNAFPEEVVQTIRSRDDVTSIIGNYDLKVLNFEKKAEKWAASKDPDKFRSFEWSYRQLSDSSKDFLRTLPEQRELSIDGRRILLVHGSPASIDEHLEPWTPEERLRELASTTPAEVIVCGHSHHAFIRIVGQTWFINTGSVGRPDDGDPRAAYAILRLEDGVLDVVHYRLQYDLERAVEAILQRGLPDEFAQMIQQGRNLADIKGQESE